MGKGAHPGRQSIPLSPEGHPEESVRSRRSVINQTRSRISYNAASRLAGRTLGGLISLVTLHFAASYFRPEGWGPIAGAVAFVTLLATLADFGVASVLARDLVTETDTRRLFGAGLTAALGLSAVATLVAAAGAAALFSNLPTTRSLILILLPTIPASAVFASLSAVFIARSRNDIRAAFDVVSSLLPLVGVLVIVRLHTRQDSYAAVLSVASAIIMIAGFAVAARYVSPNFGFIAPRARSLARQALPLGLSQTAGAIYLKVDLLIVVAFLSTAQVGYYGVATRVATFFASIAGMVTTAAVPAFMKKDSDGRRALARRLLRSLSMGAGATALVGVLFPRLALEVAAGHSYLPATGALRLLLIAAAVGFPSALFSAIIFLTGNQRYLWRIALLVLCLNVIANLIAVPIWGIEGAAGSLVLSEIVQLAAGALVAHRVGFGNRELQPAR